MKKTKKKLKTYTFAESNGSSVFITSADDEYGAWENLAWLVKDKDKWRLDGVEGEE